MFTNKRALTPDEWEKFKELNHDFYQFFVQKAADGRHKTWAEIDEIAQGRVWIGQSALELGLIDTLGGLNTALAIAKDKAGLAPETRTQWIVYPQPKGFFESLYDKFDILTVRVFKAKNGEIDLLGQLPSETKAVLRQLALSSRLSTKDVLALAPFIPEIQ